MCVFKCISIIKGFFLIILFSLAYANSWLQANDVDTDVENFLFFLINNNDSQVI